MIQRQVCSMKKFLQRFDLIAGIVREPRYPDADSQINQTFICLNRLTDNFIVNTLAHN